MTEYIGTSLEEGAALIRRYARALADTPGVYRMIDEKGGVLYVGKAKSLKKRVVRYARVNALPLRLKRMVAETKEMLFVQTHTETEALLLESNLIKKLKPKYNVLLRDDKSFPYILITEHEFPLLTKHRGAKKEGEYFGPFASAGGVNRTINALQRGFMLRNCSDSVFANRKRPCLQYHIKRCTAPCVEYVSHDEYAGQVQQAIDFLSGKSRVIQDALQKNMQEASDNLDFETAARFRDRIRALTTIQSSQDINIEGLGDVDVMAFHRDGNKSCVQVFFFRVGQNFGNRAYYPRHSDEDTDSAIMGAFVAQFYENKPVPREVLVNVMPDDCELLEEALSQKSAIKAKTKITAPHRGHKRKIVDFAIRNAREALARESLKISNTQKLLEGVAALFDMDDTPSRIEVYDNSHISGIDMVGAMIVSGPDGFQKNAYRKFNIRQAQASDDYGMMREVMTRRFKRALQEAEENGYRTNWPDLLLIDGGLGQYNAVKDVLEELGVFDQVTMVSIAKGLDRNAGRETFFCADKKPFQLPVNDPVLHYLQRLRDEAHRFAIGAHRQKRAKKIETSPLDDVPGIGAKRKKALLLHFGSAKAVAQAAMQDLKKVEGISQSMAEQIYGYFHDDG